MVKAVALLSGGLDSTLAAKLALEQGIEVKALHFKSPFCTCDRANGCGAVSLNMAEQLGIELKVIFLGKEYFPILENPKHGYGKNLNPCIDCRILILKKAKEFMKEVQASFLVTGEVIGQRPMSQHLPALKVVEKESGLEGLILRPLSAKRLPESLPEKKGWVKRGFLMDITGRSRKSQMEMARIYRIKDYPSSAGGCLLTDAGFSRRLADLMEKDGLSLDGIELLKVGRHFRFNHSFKLVVGRDEKENERIESLRKEADFLFKPLDKPGPTGLGRGKLNEAIKILSTKIIARYSSSEDKLKVKITNKEKGLEETITVTAPQDNKYRKYMI